MTTYDTIFRNGTVVGAGGLSLADIGVRDGIIVAVAPTLDGTADHERDCSGLHLLPGLIDAHVHFNEPGRTDWEGWESGSRSLAAGGGTFAIDMPLNSDPPVLSAAEVQAKVVAAEHVSVVDFALWGGLTPVNLSSLDELADAGVIGFKAFMSNSGIPEFPAADDFTLLTGMEVAARRGLVVGVHAENDRITQELGQRAMTSGRTTWADWAATRPVVAETEAIARAIHLARATGCKLHIVHVSSGAGVAEVAAARAAGIDVTCETCPHYLTFTDGDRAALGALGKCAPPFRSDAERSALWDAVRDGTVHTIGSDHSPAPASMKTGDDAFAVWGGISGCQSTLSALLTEGVQARDISLRTIAAVTAGDVAERFRLGNRGSLAPGKVADIVIVDMNKTMRLEKDSLLYRHKQSPYVGKTFRGTVVATYASGRAIWHHGRIVDARRGRFVRPS